MKTRLPLLLALCLFALAARAAEPPVDGIPPLPTEAADGCALPPHSSQFTFWNSCSNVTIDGCTLKANCRTRNGNSRATTFDMSKFPQCYSDIFGGRNLVNEDGKLCCGYAGTPMICGT